MCTFFGVTCIDGRFAMVLEYLEGGSLEALLRTQRRSKQDLQPAMLCRMASEVAAGLAFHPLPLPSTPFHALPLTPAFLLRQVAAGLAFLHRNGIIHRDIKAANVLLDGLKRAKVADFGISKASALADAGMARDARDAAGRGEARGHTSGHTMGVGTPRYAAPEVFSTQPDRTYDERVDVYSFGFMLWEMSHIQVAFEGIPGLQVAIRAAAGARPDIALAGRDGLEGFGDLIEACWHHEPSARMSMPACAEKLAGMLRRLQPPAAEGPPAHGPPGDDGTVPTPSDGHGGGWGDVTSGDVTSGGARMWRPAAAEMTGEMASAKLLDAALFAYEEHTI